MYASIHPKEALSGHNTDTGTNLLSLTKCTLFTKAGITYNNVKVDSTMYWKIKTFF